jgi:hypothetical protein
MEQPTKERAKPEEEGKTAPRVGPDGQKELLRIRERKTQGA